MGGDSRRGGPDSTALLLDELLELHDVCGEHANALGGLFRGHRILVESETETLLVEADLLGVGGLCLGGVEFARKGLGAGLELAEELRADREQVTAGQLGDLALVAKRCPHDLGGMAKL